MLAHSSSTMEDKELADILANIGVAVSDSLRGAPIPQSLFPGKLSEGVPIQKDLVQATSLVYCILIQLRKFRLHVLASLVILCLVFAPNLAYPVLIRALLKSTNVVNLLFILNHFT